MPYPLDDDNLAALAPVADDAGASPPPPISPDVAADLQAMLAGMQRGQTPVQGTQVATAAATAPPAPEQPPPAPPQPDPVQTALRSVTVPTEQPTVSPEELRRALTPAPLRGDETLPGPRVTAASPAPSEPTKTVAGSTTNAPSSQNTPQGKPTTNQPAPSATPTPGATQPLTVDQLLGAFKAREGSGSQQTSIAGAVGNYQIMPGTWKQFAHPGEDPKNPTDNENVARRYVTYLNDKYHGDAAKIATAYFSGEGNVNNSGTGLPWVNGKQDDHYNTTANYVKGFLAKLPGGSDIYAKLNVPEDQLVMDRQQGGTGTTTGTATTQPNNMDNVFTQLQKNYQLYQQQQPVIMAKMEQMRQDYLNATKPSTWDQFQTLMNNMAQGYSAARAQQLATPTGRPDNTGFMQALQNQASAQKQQREFEMQRQGKAADMGNDVLKQQLTAMYQSMGYDVQMAEHMATNQVAQQRIKIEQQTADQAANAQKIQLQKNQDEVSNRVRDNLKNNIGFEDSRPAILAEFDKRNNPQASEAEQEKLAAQIMIEAQSGKKADGTPSEVFKAPLRIAKRDKVTYQWSEGGVNKYMEFDRNTDQAKIDEVVKKGGIPYNPPSMSVTMPGGDGGGGGGKGRVAADGRPLGEAQNSLRETRTTIAGIRELGQLISDAQGKPGGWLESNPTYRAIRGQLAQAGIGSEGLEAIKQLYNKQVSKLQMADIKMNLPPQMQRMTQQELQLFIERTIGPANNWPAVQAWLDYMDQSAAFNYKKNLWMEDQQSDAEFNKQRYKPENWSDQYDKEHASEIPQWKFQNLAEQAQRERGAQPTPPAPVIKWFQDNTDSKGNKPKVEYHPGNGQWTMTDRNGKRYRLIDNNKIEEDN